MWFCRLEYVLLLLGSYGTNKYILAFTGFAGNYRGSSKEPDYSFCPNSSAFPSLVIEAGWAESFPHLRNDKDLWMDGCPSVELVLLIRWTKISGNRVKGMLEVWRRNGAGGLSVTEMVGIFFSLSDTQQKADIKLFSQYFLVRFLSPPVNSSSLPKASSSDQW